MTSYIYIKLAIIFSIMKFCLIGPQYSYRQTKHTPTQSVHTELCRIGTYNTPKMYAMTHKQRNKLTKILNGNRNKPRVKRQPHYKIALWNKASSFLSTKFEGFPIIKNSILSTNASIIALSEANILPENLKNIEGQFKEYDVHHKIIPGSKMSRIAVRSSKHTKSLKN